MNGVDSEMNKLNVEQLIRLGVYIKLSRVNMVAKIHRLVYMSRIEATTFQCDKSLYDAGAN